MEGYYKCETQGYRKNHLSNKKCASQCGTSYQYLVNVQIPYSGHCDTIVHPSGNLYDYNS